MLIFGGAMPPMTGKETAGYITHHLRLAGRSDPLFSDDATALIHTTAAAIPAPSTTSPSSRSSLPTLQAKAIVDEQAAHAAVTEVTDS
jgi:hypothetical protein